MADYDAVTLAQFRLAKPQFTAVADDLTQLYLDMAGRMVDTTWTVEDYPNAVIAFACHLMTLDGLGTDAASLSFASGRGDVQTIRSGEVTISRFARDAGETPYAAWMNSTPCGKFYMFLARLNRGGPRVVTASCGSPSPYAKDWPNVWQQP